MWGLHSRTGRNKDLGGVVGRPKRGPWSEEMWGKKAGRRGPAGGRVSSHSGQGRSHFDCESCANMGSVKVSWNVLISGGSRGRDGRQDRAARDLGCAELSGRERNGERMGGERVRQAEEREEGRAKELERREEGSRWMERE